MYLSYHVGSNITIYSNGYNSWSYVSYLFYGKTILRVNKCVIINLWEYYEREDKKYGCGVNYALEIIKCYWSNYRHMILAVVGIHYYSVSPLLSTYIYYQLNRIYYRPSLCKLFYAK